jgi:biotin carboxylase
MRKLAILGASYLQKPLVEKAKFMGLETHVFAWHEGNVVSDIADFFYPISILDKEAILIKCQAIGIHGILSIASDIAMPTISYVASCMGLVGNSIKSTSLATDKFKMRSELSKNNIPCPRFACYNAPSFKNKEAFEFPLIVKPTDRSGSRGVTKVNTVAETNIAISKALKESLNNNVIVEEFIQGNREVSVEFISHKGQHYPLAITDKITSGAPYFVELEHHQPAMLSPELVNQINELTSNALTVLDVEYGASHTEIIINNQGKQTIVEVGARMGGDFIGSHLVNLSTGFDFVEAAIKVALGESIKIKKVYNKYAGIYFLSQESAHLLPYFKKDNPFDIQKELFSDSIKTINNSSDRSGYLIYQANEPIHLG